ncbi:hypothetical protein BC939DRAFT_459926, partial [Gamsiella multidivaricata]|uniref:uncharacterized protein n=1 Tax=Gamsiella multidivaricata TaxID=101098 RepID=UPI00221FEAEE
MSASIHEPFFHTSTAITTNPLASSTTPTAEIWDDLSTSEQPQLKVEPMSPFGGSSLTLNLSQSQLYSGPQTETSQPHSLPLSMPSAHSQVQNPSQLQPHTPSLTMPPSSIASLKAPLHTSQLPPVPPSLSMPQHQQLYPSRSLLQPQSRLNNSSSALPQHQQFGLAHLSEIMAGGLMVNKSSTSIHLGGSSHRPPPLPSLPGQAMFQDQASSLMSMHPQSQSQPSSSHSTHDPFSYDQSATPIYPSPQDQQQRQAAFLMSRGSSSSSTCSTSSSATYQLNNNVGSNGFSGVPMIASSSTGSTTSFTTTDSDTNSGSTTIVKVFFFLSMRFYFYFYFNYYCYIFLWLSFAFLFFLFSLLFLFFIFLRLKCFKHEGACMTQGSARF